MMTIWRQLALARLVPFPYFILGSSPGTPRSAPSGLPERVGKDVNTERHFREIVKEDRVLCRFFFKH